MPFLSKAWNWFSNNPVAQLIGGLVLALIGWEVVKRNIQETGRIKERERMAAAVAREAVKTAETQRTIERNLDEAAARADQARADLPEFQSADELRTRRPDIAADILPGGGGDR